MSELREVRFDQGEGMKKASVFVALFVVGMLVFFVGGYWAGIPYWARTVAKIALPCLLLVATVACSRTESWTQWRPASLAFFAASFAFLVAGWVSSPLMTLCGFTADSVSGVAIAKLLDAIPVVVTVILDARLGGVKPADLYLQTGKLRAWLIVGLVRDDGRLVVLVHQKGEPVTEHEFPVRDVDARRRRRAAAAHLVHVLVPSHAGPPTVADKGRVWDGAAFPATVSCVA